MDRIRIAMQMESRLSQQAKERQRGRQDGVLLPPTLAEASKGETREKLAAIAGVSHGTYDKAKRLLLAAESGDECAIALVSEVETNARTFSGAHRQLVRKVRESTVIEQPPIPTGKFDVLYADPPWRYDYVQSDSREIEKQYPTMELGACPSNGRDCDYSDRLLEDICNIPVERMCHEDAVLLICGVVSLLEYFMQLFSRLRR